MPGFSLVKKYHATAKKPVENESDWIRVFSAQESGVILLYPHCTSELQL